MRISPLLLFAASAAHAAITGTIIGTDGKPVAGATIEALVAEGSAVSRARLLSSSPQRTPVASVQSAQNGSFSIDPKSPLADLVVRVGGRTAAMVEIPDGEDAGVIVASPESHRGVRIVADGKPVSDALVVAGPLTVRTNAQGEADTPDTVLGRPIVIVPGLAPYEEMVADAGFGRPTLTLTRGVALTGKVVAADGSPVEHAAVAVDGWPLGETNAAGEFAIAHAPKNWRRTTAVRGALAGEVLNKGRVNTIRLAPAVTISGVVHDPAGKAIAGARVMLRRPNDPSTPDSVISDATGAFAFPPVTPGDYSLLAIHQSYAFSDTTITASKSTTKSIEGKPFTAITGRVVDESHAPVAGAVVSFGIRPFFTGG
ncbi:MAG TPA: carboxypeptidase-like regulatory domain-containing protein, partial [Thermoanaerobaculia bacterium]|nr:carboxypeptidase-like regulatory domain-containing protein [Thermoanaerobaculia bacterium]